MFNHCNTISSSSYFLRKFMNKETQNSQAFSPTVYVLLCFMTLFLSKWPAELLVLNFLVLKVLFLHVKSNRNGSVTP